MGNMERRNILILSFAAHSAHKSASTFKGPEWLPLLIMTWDGSASNTHMKSKI